MTIKLHFQNVDEIKTVGKDQFRDYSALDDTDFVKVYETQFSTDYPLIDRKLSGHRMPAKYQIKAISEKG